MAEFLSRSVEETEAWAGQWSSLLRPGQKIALHGTLGAGKTALVRGLCRAMGYTEEVHSPTYALMHEYPTRIRIFHLDLYRLEQLESLEDLGLESWDLEEAICLIEWPERLKDPWMKWDAVLRLEHASEQERWIRWDWQIN